jgi:hypothetical protein
MRLLLYCVFRTADHPVAQPLSGVGGQPVVPVSHNGLSAAVSRVPLRDLTPTVSRVVAYGNVIETLRQVVTVIPMRYGCQFERESEVIQFLAERGERCKSLLRELHGCVEMGIRVFPRAINSGERDMEVSAFGSAAEALRSTEPGRLYLAARRAHYGKQERLIEESNALTERCRAAFAGLFVKCKTEKASPGARRLAFRTPLASLYFLLRREWLESFRNTFRDVASRESVRLLLSGPWPPYNFVESTTQGVRTPRS